ncbi:MAG TPA: type I DNA topoisomerase [Candidatus Caccenecus avistercoris]|nr:type I DNA topoisomerase [Candidatus Caccenecus avistercoris]
MSELVIVESPAKSKTIEKYLGSNYHVVSSKGHIRDLATTGKYGLGIDIEEGFKPNYVPIKGKKKDIAALKKLASSSDKVILATDPDREGEAISWHLYDELGLDEEKSERVVFNEITKDVVIDAINHPRKIDMDLVKSQETRRMLDRIIGFRLSKLMQRKTGGKSAGRVQSVALKLIVDREREILAFVPEEYWTIEADFKTFKASLEKYLGKKVEIKNEVEADEILNKLSLSFKIDSVEEKEKLKKPKDPFRTSTLQQMAANRLNFSSSKTMQIAQKLYEGMNIGSETVGLITYMRTDSTRLSDVFVNDTKNYIKGKYGAEYVGSVKASREPKGAQDAHEAIRPTSIMRTPESIKEYLSNDEYKLYRLIYIRSLAYLMSSAKTLATTVNLENNGYMFKATGSVLKFDGYLKVYSEYEDNEDVILPDFKNYNSDVVIADKIEKFQHFTKPAPRYTEASLIKEMESLGIGRPSTYATIMKTILDRGYVKLEDKKFFPTDIGFETTDKLQEFFSNIVNVEYTANMETELDEIADHKINNVEVLQKFYDEFSPLVDKAFKEMEKKEPVKTGEVCPECGSDLVVRKGKYGEFVACSNYPTCKYVKKEVKEVKSVAKCPKCGHDIIERKTKKGKAFYGCSNFPKCKYATWYEPTGENCPNCQNLLVTKNKNVLCEECGYVK